MKINYARLAPPNKPLKLELETFCLRPNRAARAWRGEQALAALEVAHGILDKIEEHARLRWEKRSGLEATFAGRERVVNLPINASGSYCRACSCFRS